MYGLKKFILNDLKNETLFKRFIQTKPMFTWLDDEQNWFTYRLKEID